MIWKDGYWIKASKTAGQLSNPHPKGDNDAKEARKVIEDRRFAFKKGWKKAKPSTQKRLLRWLIDQLIYTPEGLFTYYVTSREISANTLKASGSVVSEQDSGASPNRTYHLGSSSNRPSDSYSEGASVVRASGLGAPTDEPLNNPPNRHDIMPFFPNTKDRIFAICSPLYAQGHSLREIERQTRFVKTTIKKTLNAGDLALRNYHNRQSRSHRIQMS
jgi:hypothetical protein